MLQEVAVVCCLLYLSHFVCLGCSYDSAGTPYDAKASDVLNRLPFWRRIGRANVYPVSFVCSSSVSVLSHFV